MGLNSAPETVSTAKYIGPRVAPRGSEAMDDGLSELRMQMSRCEDARALGLEELEEFIVEVARRWNSAPFEEGVSEFAQQLGNCGVATGGDLRELDRAILRDNVGMSPVHAKRFEKLVASAPYDPKAEDLLTFERRLTRLTLILDAWRVLVDRARLESAYQRA